MASISNTGKTVTIAFSVEEKAELEAKGGESWMWQIPDFSLNENNQGVLTLRPDMFKGRKLQKMTKNGETPERWMLVIPSPVMPMVPFFTKVSATTRFVDDTSTFEATLPRELPPLSERKARIAALGAKPAPASAKPKAAPKPEAKSQTAVATIPAPHQPVPQPQQRHGSNLTMLIEGKSFRYDIPLDARIRLVTELAQFATQ